MSRTRSREILIHGNWPPIGCRRVGSEERRDSWKELAVDSSGRTGTGHALIARLSVIICSGVEAK